MPAQAPSEIHALFLDAFNRGDLEALVALYEPGAVLVISGQAAVGHEAIREAYQRMLARRGRMELETRSVVESGAGLAVLHAGWTLSSSGLHRARRQYRSRAAPAGRQLAVPDRRAAHAGITFRPSHARDFSLDHRVGEWCNPVLPPEVRTCCRFILY